MVYTYAVSLFFIFYFFRFLVSVSILYAKALKLPDSVNHLDF